MDYRKILYPWNYYKRRVFAFIVLLSIGFLHFLFKIPSSNIFSPDYLIFRLGEFDVTVGRLISFPLLVWIAWWIWRGQSKGL